MTAVVAIVGGAVASRAWWLMGFAIAALISTQPQHRVESLLVSETRPLVRSSRVPWLLCCALALCLLKRPQEAAWFTVTWFVVRLCAHVGEYAVATGMSIVQSRLPGRLTTFIRPAAAFVVRTRAHDSIVTIGGGVFAGTATAILANSANPTSAFGVGLLTAILIENSSGRWQWTDARLRVLGVIALAVLATRIQWWALLAPVTATFAMILVRANQTLRFVPLTQPSNPLAQSAWVDLAKGRARQVITNLEGEGSADPDVIAALAVAHAFDGHPGHAARLARLLPAQHSEVRHLIEAQVHGLLGTQPPEVRQAPNLATPLGRATQLAWLRASIPWEPAELIAAEIAGLIPARITSDNVMWAAECYLAMGETLLAVDQVTAGTAASRAFALTDLYVTQDRDFLDRATLEARQLKLPAPHELGARGAAVTKLAFAGDQESPAMFLLDDDALMVLTELSSPFVVAAYCNRGADLHLKNRGRVTAESIELRVQAFASLNVVRHELADPDDRACWWDAFIPTLDTLLEEVHEFQDWPLLLEVIEAARLQLGTNREDLRPTALRIGGRSRLGSQRYYFGSRPTMVDLEYIINTAGRQGAWWWSTHVSRGQLYWAATNEDPQVKVHGGRISMSVVTELLNELNPHLSLQAEGESDHDFFLRMSVSALLAPPSEIESALAERVGQLLPKAIRVQEPHNRIRTTICMALAPELAHIPWAWARIGGRHLVELFDTVIVPPASILPPPDAGDDQNCPIAVGLVDPGGDLSAAVEGSAHLPSQAAIIDGQTGDRRASLTAALRAAPYDSTLFLACHTVTINNRRGFALAPLDKVDVGDVLFASDIAHADTDFPMPRQVIALACESSDMASAHLGEWTVLGTALIQAGARRALVTAFPILDLPEVDQFMVTGVSDGTPLHVLIASFQLSLLRRWRDGETSAAPLAWAGLQLFGSLPAAQETATPRPPAWAEENLVRGIDAAAEYAPRGRPTVEVADLMTYFAIYGHIDGLPRRVRAAVRRTFITKWPTPLHLIGQRTFFARLDHQPRVISDDLLDVIADARELAVAAGHSVYDIDHVFVAALRSNHPSCVAMRNLTGFDTRNPAVVQRFVEDERDIHHSTGQALTPHLASGEAERIYETLGIAPPTGEDRWLHSDRVV
ncbi:CHAT domain-containing protein [Knoellia sinensis]|uniref:CHAT domain-containing protein n=1 Tax=Knoellia sinensis TaxID=136100 RepID=UPI0014701182|nr:CHAT domain-containing protein [Knoellia sinensis]